MKLLLVRHGETAENAKRLLQGQSINGPLSEAGLAQAVSVAKSLAKEKISAIYSSDLKRAAQTAEIIAKEHAIPVTLAPLLRERSFGEFEGKPISFLDECAAKAGTTRYAMPMQNGEHMDHFYARISDFLSSLSKIHKDTDTIVIVSHKGVLRMILAAANGLDPTEAMSIPSKNVEVIELVLPKKEK